MKTQHLSAFLLFVLVAISYQCHNLISETPPYRRCITFHFEKNSPKQLVLKVISGVNSTNYNTDAMGVCNNLKIQENDVIQVFDGTEIIEELLFSKIDLLLRVDMAVQDPMGGKPSLQGIFAANNPYAAQIKDENGVTAPVDIDTDDNYIWPAVDLILPEELSFRVKDGFFSSYKDRVKIKIKKSRESTTQIDIKLGQVLVDLCD
ncbi:MAG: hypothetical protein IPL65_12405 [Lewinellaceae bacterium]|nr:hypothetical protein [Lewinellaceae bacterium]